MGITAIKRIENRSRSTVQVINRENPTSRGSNRVIGSGGSIAADIWIPWAPKAEDFLAHHLEIQQFGRTRYWIWQAANADGDFIRFSTDGLWHNQGEKVHGYPGVAKNIFEAVGGAVLSGQLQPLGDLLLGERALVVLDSHFETIPIAPKLPQIPDTHIKRIENLSSKSVVLFNKEKNTSSAIIASGGSADVNMTVPWAGQATDFRKNRLELRLDGQTRYWIWQAESVLDGDYIRFATTESWSATATRVNGIPATGETPADLVFTHDRALIVRDSGFELWPHPLFIDGILGTLKSLAPSARRVSETALTPAPPSVPKKSAVAFSLTAPASDAFKRGQRGARFLYNDSGKRYEFTINSAGTVVAKDPDGKSTPLNAGWSYNDLRVGKNVIPPPFDLIAASGGRIFAKARDRNDFYIGTMDHTFIHAPKEAAADAVEIVIPSTSFKLDPQFGTGANSSGLLASTNDIPPDCPMSERFPLFRRLMQRELLDFMIARLEPGVLQQIDSRPTQNVIGLALRNALLTLGPGFNLLGFGLLLTLAPSLLFEFFKAAIAEALRSNVELGSAPPPGVPTYRPVTYALPDGTRFSPPAIKFERVLDIGVSHVHWFQQYQLAIGGELQPMLLSEFLQSVYRFFNGPVQDGDGFIDSTCNVYALVKHEPTPERPHGYALLFQDEQWYFNQRWRLVDPDDNKGLFGSITSDLGNPSYQWNPATYWCPFRNGHINERSRLAVAAHVLLVTGNDPVSNVPRIYSINFAWTSMDRTWRYRQLPAGEVTFFDQAMLESGNETVLTDIARVYPQTIRLREDMTIHIKGARNVDGRTVAGRWYQRYLPVNNVHVPAKEELVAGKMPVRGYTHGWKFLPENVFMLADSFSHFGVYDTVDSRCQYYDVTPASAADAATLDAGGPGPWIDNTRQLYVSQWKFRWDVQHPGADPIDPPSLFNADTRLRIVRRGTRWIAMHWDKRDDDLVAFERLPMTVTLNNGTSAVRVAIGPHHRIRQQPMVRNAWMWLEPDGTAGVAFLPVGSPSIAVRDNVWRVRIAALEAFEDPATQITRARSVPLVDVTTEGAFTPVGFGRYERRWTPTAAEATALQRYCSSAASANFATSIWFEDVVGHVSTPESIAWQRSHSVSAFATPSSVFLDRPVEVMVTARDSRTQQPLDGEVLVNDVVVARTGQKFTHTFKLTLPPRTFINLDDKEPIEIPEPIPPVVTVLVRDYPPAQVDIEFVPYFSGAAFVRQSIPTSMITGNSYQASVTMRNNGTSTWTNGGTNPFRLGSQSPQDNSTWGGRRELPGPVAPGAEVTFTFDVIAPASGMHSFRWRMLQELIEWFGDLTPDVPVWVIGRTMSVSATPNPAPLNTLVSVVVRAVDSETGAPVDGLVSINDIVAGDTNTAFNFTFRKQVIGVKPNIEIIYPFGTVHAPGYEFVRVDFGFPDI